MLCIIQGCIVFVRGGNGAAQSKFSTRESCKALINVYTEAAVRRCSSK